MKKIKECRACKHSRHNNELGEICQKSCLSGSGWEPIESEKNDEVANPSHYTHGKYEPRKVIADWKLNFNLGNAIKYICRADHKGNKKKDLEKAIQYLKFELEEVE